MSNPTAVTCSPGVRINLMRPALLAQRRQSGRKQLLRMEKTRNKIITATAYNAEKQVRLTLHV